MGTPNDPDCCKDCIGCFYRLTARPHCQRQHLLIERGDRELVPTDSLHPHVLEFSIQKGENCNTNPATTPVNFRSVLPSRQARAMVVAQNLWEEPNNPDLIFGLFHKLESIPNTVG